MRPGHWLGLALSVSFGALTWLSYRTVCGWVSKFKAIFHVHMK